MKNLNNKITIPYVLFGLRETKTSNNGTQYYQQDRVYNGMCDIALCLPAGIPGGSYRYLFKEGK